MQMAYFFKLIASQTTESFNSRVSSRKHWDTTFSPSLYGFAWGGITGSLSTEFTLGCGMPLYSNISHHISSTYMKATWLSIPI
jgi:hypothetical protein